MVVQRSYSINPPVGFPGTIAEPNSPTRVERGVLHIGASDGRDTGGARPGDALFWDTTNDAWRVAHDGGSVRSVAGFLSYPADTVANASSIVTFASGAEIEIVTMGVVWVVAGGNVERHNFLEFQQGDYKYDNLARQTAIANLHTNPIECYSTSGSDGDIIKAAIGYGRVI